MAPFDDLFEMPNYPVKLVLPDIPAKPIKIGGNTVHKLIRRSKSVEFDSCVQEGNAMRLENGDGDSVIISVDGSLRGLTAKPEVLSADVPLVTHDSFSQPLSLAWKKVPDPEPTRTPDEISQSWKGAFRFVEGDPVLGTIGLREPQIGAIHAVCAHLTVDTIPATVVMPTGTGKTETMLSIMTYRPFRRVMILVPSDALRTQLAGKFATLGYLPDIGVLPPDVEVPSVCMVKKGISSAEEVRELAAATNVFVATAAILKSFSTAALDELCSACDILFVDEAHHIAAKTWKSVKDRFVQASRPVIQFTATPFRDDGGNLQGKIIFNYPLRKAQERGYFKPIRFFPVSEYMPTQSDRAVASKAIQVLREDLEAGLDHYLMARVSTTKRAEEIAGLYAELATEWEPMVVHSNMGSAAKEAALRKFLSGESRICICVKMLGEGFDFPKLKVAAIHDTHKSLAVTLQFVGRFTRTGDLTLGDAAFVANVAEPQVEGDLQRLYSQSPDWDHIIKQQSQQQIEREIRNQELIEGFRDRGDLNKVISLWNLRPASSAIIFRVPPGSSMDLSLVSDLLPKGSKEMSSYNPNENLFVCVAERNEEVKWGRYKGIQNHDLELLVIRHIPSENALFIHSSNYEFFRAEKLAETVIPGSVPVAGEPVFRVFSKVERPMVRNLGARKVGDISFTMHFGPNVLGVMSDVEQGLSELSNLAGWGYEDGERRTWGCSQKKGKVWSQGGGDILDWIDWSNSAWSKVSDNTLEKSQVISRFLCGMPMTNGRPISAPILVEWGDSIAMADEENISITMGGRDFTLSEVDLKVDDFAETGDIHFSVRADGLSALFRISYSVTNVDVAVCAYESLDGGVSIKVGSRQPITLEELAKRDPLVITYANGDRSYNQYLIERPQGVGNFPLSSIREVDWAGDGINIREESQGASRSVSSIQYRMSKFCLDEYDIVFDDDNKGEAADLVCVRFDESNNTLEILFVHCKFSSADSAGRRVEDLYEVCGQTQKSIHWKHGGFAKLVNHMKIREQRWQTRGNTRFMKGDVAQLGYFKEIARKSRVNLEMWIAQPGVSKAGITEAMLLILGATEDYVSKTTGAKLTVFASA